MARLKHIEFVPLEPGKALVVLVGDDQSVENRVISLPAGAAAVGLAEAANYLNAHIRGSTIAEARARIEARAATPRPSSTSSRRRSSRPGLPTGRARSTTARA